MPIAPERTLRRLTRCQIAYGRMIGRRGFSLVEAMVALTLVSVAGAALLVQAGAHLRFAVDSVDEAVAMGVAQQLMDEIAGCKYVSDGQSSTSTTFGPSAWEASGAGRERFDDIDDFHGYSASPPVDRYGVALGQGDGAGGRRHTALRASASAFTNWRETVGVYYVNNADPSQRLAAGQSSNYREVEVVITFNDPVEGTVELARVRRVFAYIPTP